jgi:acyl-coenzyme A synthetase/AMP-(fatty) acid ligase
MYGFTSGSTGAPKIAPMRYSELARRVTRTGPTVITPTDRAGMLLGATSGALRRMIEAFGRGVTITCLDAREASSDRILAAFARDDVTFLWMIPTYLRRLVTDAEDGTNLPSLRVIVTSGEPLHWRDVDLVRRRLSSRCAIRHPYGSTETGSIAVRFVDPDEPLGEGVVPVGRARDGVRISIVDPSGERVPDGHPGEVVVESALVRAADQDGTSEDGVALRRTGDYGRLRPDGQLELLGRVDRMVKIGGIRAQPARVEHELRALDWIDEVAVIPRTQQGEAQPALVAHVVGSVVDDAAAASRIREHLATRVHPAEIPQEIVFHAERLPTLPSGKVDAVALLQRGEPPQRG